MGSTCKADKYVRLLTNIIKLLRSITGENKTKYTLIYK
jgi:hypothetical protein